MEEGMIQAQAMAARMACRQMTTLHLTALHDGVERARCLAGRSQWGRKAAAHAEIFSLLANVVDDPLLAPLLTGSAAYMREVMLTVGRAADGMIVSSRWRLLAHIRRGLAGTGLLPVPERADRVLHGLARHAGTSFGLGLAV